MTLRNLLAIGRLKAHEASVDERLRLRAAIRRNLTDAAVAAVSDETRFDAACKALMQCARVGLLVSGYRPVLGEEGHHQTLIQSLPLTLGVPRAEWVALDALRRHRNASDYTGSPITAAGVTECIRRALDVEARLGVLIRDRHAWLIDPQAR